MSGLGFRRRCAWCGVQLRGWQLNKCRECGLRTGDCGIYLQSGGPPCHEQSRWGAEPDDWPRFLRDIGQAAADLLRL